MGNTAMIYPSLGNGEAVTRFSDQIIEQVLKDAPAWPISVQAAMPLQVSE
jgi:hypothetical protein